MLDLFPLQAASSFRSIIDRYRLQVVVAPDGVVYLVSDKCYALSLSNEREGITVWYVSIKGPHDLRLYNLPLFIGLRRRALIPRDELHVPATTPDEHLSNYALLLQRCASDVLAGDTTWLEEAPSPVRLSSSVTEQLYAQLMHA